MKLYFSSRHVHTLIRRGKNMEMLEYITRDFVPFADPANPDLSLVDINRYILPTLCFLSTCG